jgi:hypothetical protein
VVLPAWSALTEHVPAASSVMTEPFVPPEVQTAGVVVVNVTVRPEDAVAFTVIGDCDNLTLLSPPKVIVCEPLPTVTDCWT